MSDTPAAPPIDMSTKIINIHGKLAQVAEASHDAEGRWIASVVNPYSSAYRSALEAYRGTIQKQADSNRNQLDMAFMALALCGGTLLTTALASTIRGAILNSVINYVCNHNMQRIFNAIHFTLNSPATQFAIGGIVTHAGGTLFSAIRQHAEVSMSLHGSSKIQSRPSDVEAALLEFTKAAQSSVSYAVRAIGGDTRATIQDRALLYGALINSVFMRPPTDRLDGGENSRLAREIEFSFYMNMILNTDHLVRLVIDKKHGRYEHSRMPIDISPRSHAYPHQRHHSSPEYTQHVEYDRLGQVIIDRINTLHNGLWGGEFINSKFFGQRTSATLIERAESRLKLIGNFNNYFSMPGQPLIIDPDVQAPGWEGRVRQLS